MFSDTVYFHLVSTLLNASVNLLAGYHIQKPEGSKEKAHQLPVLKYKFIYML